MCIKSTNTNSFDPQTSVCPGDSLGSSVQHRAAPLLNHTGN